MLAGALVLGVGGSATLAAWTDQETASTTVTAGTFALASRTAADQPFVAHDADDAAIMTFQATGLYPGQSRAAWIQIRNTGSVPAAVSVSAVTATTDGEAGEHLADALEVRYVPLPVTDDPDTAPSCTPSTTGGTVVTGLRTAPTGSVELDAGETMAYCLVLTLPSNAPSDAQGGSATPAWTFTGTTS